MEISYDRIIAVKAIVKKGDAETEEESAELKMFIKDTDDSDDWTINQLRRQICENFPLEYGEALDELPAYKEEVKRKQVKQAQHNMHEFTRLALAFYHDGNKELFQYWKGQVMGTSKMIKLFDLSIETKSYLSQLP